MRRKLKTKSTSQQEVVILIGLPDKREYIRKGYKGFEVVNIGDDGNRLKRYIESGLEKDLQKGNSIVIDLNDKNEKGALYPWICKREYPTFLGDKLELDKEVEKRIKEITSKYNAKLKIRSYFHYPNSNIKK